MHFFFFFLRKKRQASQLTIKVVWQKDSPNLPFFLCVLGVKSHLKSKICLLALFYEGCFIKQLLPQQTAFNIFNIIVSLAVIVLLHGLSKQAVPSSLIANIGQYSWAITSFIFVCDFERLSTRNVTGYGSE